MLTKYIILIFQVKFKTQFSSGSKNLTEEIDWDKIFGQIDLWEKQSIANEAAILTSHFDLKLD